MVVTFTIKFQTSNDVAGIELIRVPDVQHQVRAVLVVPGQVGDRNRWRFRLHVVVDVHFSHAPDHAVTSKLHRSVLIVEQIKKCSQAESNVILKF